MENRTIGKTVGNTANSEYGGKVKSRYKPRTSAWLVYLSNRRGEFTQ